MDLKSTVKVCMFDQYGTVVDMQSGLVEAATPFLRAKGWQGNPESFVTWWRRTHFENSMIDALLGREHTPYRIIGERAVAHVMDRSGIRHTPDEVRALVSHIERLRPFPEVPAALERLRTRYKLVVLSNGDPDMLEAARRHHEIAFDHVISVAVPTRSSRIMRLMPRRRRSSACRWIRCCSSPTTSSTASAPRRRACAPRSSTAVTARSARGRISRTSWCRT